MITDCEPPPSLTVAILGAGPAGMSCANACLSFGLIPVVIERSDHAGGAQRTNFHPNLWMLGAPGETGETMTRRMADHYAGLAVDTRYGTEVVGVEGEAGEFTLSLKTAGGGSPAPLHAGAIVLATGMRPRSTPALDKLARASRRVIIGALSDTIRDGIRSARVLILGGGDNALDHALFLAERDNRVLVCTRHGFSARAGFLASCGQQAKVRLRDECIPVSLDVTGEQIRADWEDVSEVFDWLLVMYGYRLNTEVLACFAPALRPDLTASGHVLADAWQRTSVPGLYAAGDITDSPQPSVVTAIAHGLAAARAIERQRNHLSP